MKKTYTRKHVHNQQEASWIIANRWTHAKATKQQKLNPKTNNNPTNTKDLAPYRLTARSPLWVPWHHFHHGNFFLRPEGYTPLQPSRWSVCRGARSRPQASASYVQKSKEENFTYETSIGNQPLKKLRNKKLCMGFWKNEITFLFKIQCFCWSSTFFVWLFHWNLLNMPNVMTEDCSATERSFHLSNV